jgi:hypothetical protein
MIKCHLKMDKMKNKLKDSNAPPQTRGTPFQCRNAGMQECVNEKRMENRSCSRFVAGVPAVSAKFPVKYLLFRSTGRDGPPGLYETTSGVPAWLEEEDGSRKTEARSQPPAARGKPLVARDRGHPPEAQYDSFHRANRTKTREVRTEVRYD